MLTKTQQEMLRRRNDREAWEDDNKTSPKERKYIDFTLRQYVKRQFDSLDHLLKVLDALPNDQLKTILTPKHVADLFKVAERSIEILPPVRVTPIEEEEDKYQTDRSYNVNFGSKLNGQKDANVWIHVTCPASEDEIEYWKMFNFFNVYLLKHIFEEISQHPPSCTLKELNQEIVPSLNRVASKRGVFCKIEPVKSIVGTPTKDWKTSRDSLTQADEILNPEKKEEPK